MNGLLYNWIAGFIIPWIAGIYLYRKRPKVVLVIAPVGISVAHIFNASGIFLEFWKVKPFEYGAFSRLPMNIGVYGILASFLIYTIIINKKQTYFFIFSFSAISTLMELAWVKIGLVVYGNGWNIFHTFLSYLLAYILVYLYYLLLKKHGVFKNTI